MACTTEFRSRAAQHAEPRIASRLQAASKGTRGYWDFRDAAGNLASKCLFQYPAMMVPALQKQVIGTILTALPDIRTIADPFLGSGTILALTMLAGRAFVGQDINPLAILIAKARAFSLDCFALGKAAARVNHLAASDRSTSYDVRFTRQAKWFTRGANIGLSRIRRAILTEQNINTRRFLWVCLAETVRLNSNSRTSTYKLHIRPEAECNVSSEQVLRSFAQIADANLQAASEFRSALLNAGHLTKRGHYRYSVHISYGDTAAYFPKTNGSSVPAYQVVVTSPPYGDNKTTVPYGQAAWLPLQWICMSDIDSAIPPDAADGYFDVDKLSLGGQLPRDFRSRQKTVEGLGRRTRRYVTKLAAVSRNGLSRFVNFTHDLRNAVTQFVGNCADGGYVVLTLGNRNICGTVCPLTDVCAELLASYDAKEVVRIKRRISSKRMPGKNGHSATINREYICLFRKISLKSSPSPQ